MPADEIAVGGVGVEARDVPDEPAKRPSFSWSRWPVTTISAFLSIASSLSDACAAPENATIDADAKTMVLNM
jgi:hypothetical protein